MYEFVGPKEGPPRQLVTNMNFHASDVCIGMATSFVTIANVTRDDGDVSCAKGSGLFFLQLVGYDSYTVDYTQLLFLVHNATYLNLFNITCNKDVVIGHTYDIL